MGFGYGRRRLLRAGRSLVSFGFDPSPRHCIQALTTINLQWHSFSEYAEEQPASEAEVAKYNLVQDAVV